MKTSKNWDALQAVAASVLARRESELPTILAYHLGRISAGCTQAYAFYKPTQDIYGQAKARVLSAIRFAR